MSIKITAHWILAALLTASNSSEKALGKISRTRQIKICANDCDSWFRNVLCIIGGGWDQCSSAEQCSVHSALHCKATVVVDDY